MDPDQVPVLFLILTIYQIFEEIKEKSSIFLILVICHLLHLTTYFFHWGIKISRLDLNLDPAGTVVDFPSGSGFGIQNIFSADPDPKEIFTKPQNCLSEVRHKAHNIRKWDFCS
jgi:hypothetical protein